MVFNLFFYFSCNSVDTCSGCTQFGCHYENSSKRQCTELVEANKRQRATCAQQTAHRQQFIYFVARGVDTIPLTIEEIHRPDRRKISQVQYLDFSFSFFRVWSLCTTQSRRRSVVLWPDPAHRVANGGTRVQSDPILHTRCHHTSADYPPLALRAHFCRVKGRRILCNPTDW